jgi:hypothetical protein
MNMKAESTIRREACRLERLADLKGNPGIVDRYTAFDAAWVLRWVLGEEKSIYPVVSKAVAAALQAGKEET